MKICVLVNPGAGSANQIEVLDPLVAAHPNVTLRRLQKDDKLGDAVVEAAKSGFDIVAIAGGDGSVHAAINAMAPNFPKSALGVIPLGTGNDLCRTLAIPLEVPEAFKTLLKSRIRKLDLIRVETPKVCYASNAITGGFSGRVAADVTSELKSTWGPLAYLRGAAGPILNRESFQIKVRFDHEPLQHFAALNVVVANGRMAAGGIVVAPHANPEDGFLDVVIVLNHDVLELSVVTARLMAGDYDDDELVIRRRVRRVEIESETPMPVSIDGEQELIHKLKCEVVNAPIRFVVGKDYRAKPGRASWLSKSKLSPIRTRIFALLAMALHALVRHSGIYLAGFAMAVLLASLFGALALDVQSGKGIKFNDDWLREIADYRTPQRTSFFRAVTWLGDPWPSTILVAVICLLLTIRRRYWDAMAIAIILIGLALLELLLKGLFAYPRPVLGEPLVIAKSYSYPSGHALRGIGLGLGFAALIVLNAPRQIWRWLIAFIITGAGVLVAGSRVYLAAHWPTDILGGAIAAIVWVTTGIMGQRVARFHWRKRSQRE